MNNSKEILEEILKCKNNPYYFATKCLKVKNTPYSEDAVDFYTPLSEEEFNKQFKELQNETKVNRRTRLSIYRR
jgi:NAD kinase